MTDWVKFCRDEAQDTFYAPLKEKWTSVGDHIEKLEAALHDVARINNHRDRFSPEIDTIITQALGEGK